MSSDLEKNFAIDGTIIDHLLDNVVAMKVGQKVSQTATLQWYRGVNFIGCAGFCTGFCTIWGDMGQFICDMKLFCYTFQSLNNWRILHDGKVETYWSWEEIGKTDMSFCYVLSPGDIYGTQCRQKQPEKNCHQNCGATVFEFLKKSFKLKLISMHGRW